MKATATDYLSRSLVTRQVSSVKTPRVRFQKGRKGREETGKNCCNFPADDQERSVTMRHSSKTRLENAEASTGIFIIGHRPWNRSGDNFNPKFAARARPSLSLSFSLCVFSLCGAIKSLSTQSTACREQLLHAPPSLCFSRTRFLCPRFACASTSYAWIKRARRREREEEEKISTILCPPLLPERDRENFELETRGDR